MLSLWAALSAERDCVTPRKGQALMPWARVAWTFAPQPGDGFEISADDSGKGRPAAAAPGDFEHQFIRALFQADRRGVLVGDFAAIDIVAMDDLAV